MHKHGTAGDCFKWLQYLQQFDSQLIAYPARSSSSCTASPAAHLNSPVQVRVARALKNSVQRCYASLPNLSTAAVYNGALLQQNPAQILAAIAMQKIAAADPAIFATDSLTDQQRIS